MKVSFPRVIVQVAALLGLNATSLFAGSYVFFFRVSSDTTWLMCAASDISGCASWIVISAKVVGAFILAVLTFWGNMYFVKHSFPGDKVLEVTYKNPAKVSLD